MATNKKVVIIYYGIFQYEERVMQDVVNLGKLVGWQVTAIAQPTTDTTGVATLNQAIALKPDAILAAHGGSQAQNALDAAAAQGIKVVESHSAAYPGPAPGLVDSIEPSPKDVAKAFVDYSIVHSNGSPRIVVLYVSAGGVAKAKGDEWVAAIKACPTCQLLELADNLGVFVGTSSGAALMASWVGKYGSQPFYVYSISDDSFDPMIPTLRNAGVSASTVMLGGTDGSPSAYQRIRTGSYQVMTGPDPDQEQTYIMFDDLNRAFHGQPIAGFYPRYYLVDKGNVNLAGGDQSIYIPQDNFAAHYLKLWGLG